MEKIETPCVWCRKEAKDSKHTCHVGSWEFVVCDACFPLLWQLTGILRSLRSAVATESSTTLSRPYV